MTELERSLATALAEVAEDAPGVVGLADAARRRWRSRRRRRASVGAVVAVLAVVVPLGLVQVLNGSGDDPAVLDDRVVGRTDDGWQTVAFDYDPLRADARSETLLVDLPPDWLRNEDDPACPGFFDYGAPGRSGPCDEAETVGVTVDGGNLDYAFGPGLRPRSDFDFDVTSAWVGHVELPEVHVSVSTDDRQVALRVLGSVRPEGEPDPDLTGPWTTAQEAGLAYPVPAVGQVDVEIGDPPAPDDGYVAGSEVAPGRWRFRTVADNGASVDVTAPSLALAQVVAGSSRADPSAGPWTFVKVRGLVVDVPRGWTVRDDCGRTVVVVVPPDGPCAPEGTRVTVLDERSTRYPGPGLGSDAGSVTTADQIVSAQGLPFDTLRRLLASVRFVGQAVPDVESWRVAVLQDGVTATVPDDPGVRVEVSGAIPSCADAPSRARRKGNGTWVVGLCNARIVTVTAPTEALAQVVAAQVSGY